MYLPVASERTLFPARSDVNKGNAKFPIRKPLISPRSKSATREFHDISPICVNAGIVLARGEGKWMHYRIVMLPYIGATQTLRQAPANYALGSTLSAAVECCEVCQ
jgi:hypothetical protein